MIVNKIKIISRKIGIDRAILYTLCGRGWQFVGGFLSVTLIVIFLTPNEMGYYYTFSSLLAMQIFVELGLSYVMQQFAAHEKAKLEWDAEGKLFGDIKAKERLASLIRLAFKWYFLAALLIVVFVSPLGYLFFLHHQTTNLNVAWHLPWFCLVLTFALLFIVTPFLSILEGCGRVSDVAKVRLMQNILANIMLWSGICSGFGLLAASLSSLGSFIVAIIWLASGWRKKFYFDILGILKKKTITKISWYREIFPFQWKITLSWLSGYFIFQLFNPVLFAFYGPKVAGQMGLTISVTNYIMAIALAWVTTKTPKFCELIAKKDFTTLDKLFFRTLWQSLSVIVFISFLFIAVVLFLQYQGYQIRERFLPILPLLLLVGTVIVNHLIGSLAMYLRAHKQEPLMVLSIVDAILMAFSTYFLGKWYSALGITLGYSIIMLFVGLFGSIIIFLRKRELWHNNGNSYSASKEMNAVC